VRFNAVCLNVRYFCGEGGRRASMSRSLSQEFSEPTAGKGTPGASVDCQHLIISACE
jgi:hypothetical protein